MWRMIFLILVVLGALAVLLAVILGIGVAKVAMVQTDEPVPTPSVAASQPTAGTSAPTPGSATAPVSPEVPEVVVVPQPAPRVEKPANYVPGTIVLRGGSAKTVGKLVRQTPPDGDLTSWTRPADYASWIFTPPTGQYRVFVTHANGANSGGEFALVLSASRNVEPEFFAKATPTGGWETFRSDFVGVLDLTDKRTTLAIRPAEDLESPLMRLRQIELIPLEPLVVADNDELAMEIIGLTLVEAATGKPLGLLTSRMVLDLATLPPLSIRVETAGPVKSVQFALDKKKVLHIESQRPFSIAGDEGGQTYTPWTPEPGRYKLTVTPYPEEGAGGKAGRKQIFDLGIVSSSPVVLSAKDAKLHGEKIRLVGDIPTIESWTRRQDWVEWATTVPYAGHYAVELLYACGKDHGGEFVFRAGDERITEEVDATGDGAAYDRLTIGRVKLKSGKTTITIKPSELDDNASLMKLREVRLVPVVEGDDD